MSLGLKPDQKQDLLQNRDASLALNRVQNLQGMQDLKAIQDLKAMQDLTAMPNFQASLNL